MYKRHLEQQILKYSREYPVVAIVGPRQSGKTTLIQKIFPNHKYLSLENINIRNAARNDPHGFLQTHGTNLILDEVQNVPELFSCLQQLVDENQDPGQYILSGSSQFLLMESITQSLAGRIVTFKLLPLSYLELKELPPEEDPRLIFHDFTKNRKVETQSDLFHLLLQGFYPRIHDKKLDPQKWYENYVLTYAERDIRKLLNVKSLRSFEHFLLLIASRSGQLLDYSDLSNALGIAVSTVKEWVSILEASGLVFLLSPFFENYSKRVVKTPKLFFVDTGILCHLLSIQNVDHLATHPLLGSIFETFIVSECYKRFCHIGERPPLYYWRDKSGNEIDLLIYDGQKCFPIEIKLSQTPLESFHAAIQKWLQLAKNPAEKGLVIYCGAHPVSTTSATPTVPWFML